MQTGVMVCPCINSRRRHLLSQSGKEQVNHNPEQRPFAANLRIETERQMDATKKEQM